MTDITFVLPGRGHAGGIRSTVNLAKALLERGHRVRLLYRQAAWSWGRLRSCVADFRRRLHGAEHVDWIKTFPGPTEIYRDIKRVEFRSGEFVVACGAYVVEDVDLAGGDIIRIRYCRGLQRYDEDLMKRAWSGTTPTVAVCRELVPDLRQLSGLTEIHVVRNGINQDEYYDEQKPRDGVGTIFGRHYAKAPEDIIAVMQAVPRRLPEAGLYMFGTSPRPAGLPDKTQYRVLPSVAKARDFYNRCRVWLIMSRTEGFSVPILEAMLCGCVVVSTEHDGSRELIHQGENGWRVPVGDIEGCAEHAVRLWRDEPLRQSIVQAGLQTAKAFTWQRAAQEFEAVLTACRDDRSGLR